MAGPLGLLRQYNVNKTEIIERDNQIIFGQLSWPKTVKTNYIIRKPKKDKHSSSKEYYTLECLLFFLKNKHLIHPVYVKQAAAANVPAVRRPDRKELLNYLNGETATCASIDKNAPLEISTQVKRTHDLDEEEPQTKKSRYDDTALQKKGEKHTVIWSAQTDRQADAPEEDSVTMALCSSYVPEWTLNSDYVE